MRPPVFLNSFVCREAFTKLQSDDTPIACSFTAMHDGTMYEGVEFPAYPIFVYLY